MTRISLLQRNKVCFSSLSLVCLLLFVVGCDSFGKKSAPAQQPAQQPIAAAAQVVVQKQISSVTLPPAQGNQFDFSTKKDPFKPFIVEDKAAGKDKTADAKNGLPLHSFDVSQFRLIGTVSDPKGNKAMVVDPAGKAYVLRIGMTIGKNEGRIAQIGTGGIDVVEQFRDDNGKLRKETIRIPLLRKP